MDVYRAALSAWPEQPVVPFSLCNALMELGRWVHTCRACPPSLNILYLCCPALWNNKRMAKPEELLKWTHASRQPFV